MSEEIDCSELDAIAYNAYLNAKVQPHYQVQGRIIKVNHHLSNSEVVTSLATNEAYLFDYQKFIVGEALKRQRYAIFADCGLGKTAMFLAWIRRLLPVLKGKKVLIISPLMVIQQTLDEEEKFYHERTIEDIHNKDLEEWAKNGTSQIGITNFDKFHEKRNLSENVGAVVLDESSILKNGVGKIRMGIIETTRGIQFKLCCSATPAPNDREEYANHATFLEYTRSNNEFYSMFFVNKDNGWEIKPHGLESFYRYLATWSIFLRSPERYKFVDNLSKLPKPIFKEIDVQWTDEQSALLGVSQRSLANEGMLLDALTKRNYYIQLSKGFIHKNEKLERIPTNKTDALLDILKKEKNAQSVVWVHFNEEERIVSDFLQENGLKVATISGSTSEEDRVKIIEEFRNGKFQILISKAKLLGFGLNLPFVQVQIFNGMSDSYEQFYQCVRRSHRFGATSPTRVYLPVTEAEKQILQNVLRKKETFEQDSNHQEDSFIKNLEGELSEFFQLPYKKQTDSESGKSQHETGREWQMFRGDSIKVLPTLEAESIDFAVFSPPFANLFTYSNDIADMGNTRDHAEFYLHFEFF